MRGGGDRGPSKGAQAARGLSCRSVGPGRFPRRQQSGRNQRGGPRRSSAWNKMPTVPATRWGRTPARPAGGSRRPYPCHPAVLPRSTSEPRWRPAQAGGVQEEAEPAPTRDWPSAPARRAAAAAGEQPGTEPPARGEPRPQQGDAGGRCLPFPVSLPSLAAAEAGAGGGGALQPGWLQLACGNLSPAVPRPPALPARSSLACRPARPAGGTELRCLELPAKNKTDRRSRFAFGPCKCPSRRLPPRTSHRRRRCDRGGGGRGRGSAPLGVGGDHGTAGLGGKPIPRLLAPCSSWRASSHPSTRGTAGCGFCVKHLIN